MLQLSNVAKSFGGDDVLGDVSFQIGLGERVGLVGNNGTGKSTILKIVVGEVELDAGQVAIAPKTSVGYLSQVDQLGYGRTLYEEMRSVFAEVNSLEQRQRELEAEMRACTGESAHLNSLLDAYGQALHDFDQADGHMVKVKIGQVLSGLGFCSEDFDRPLEHFSGGWQMRVSLARLLLANPNLLLLDEPTNHLDLRAIEWLEDYLRNYKGSVVIVSHDRYFLDRVTLRTLELADGVVTDFSGNYSFYSTEKERRRELLAAASKRQQAELAKQEEFITRFRAKATKASLVKSREKMIERIERVEAPEGQPRGITLRFRAAPSSGREAIAVRNLGKCYGSKVVFQGGQLVVERGDRIAIVGSNGSGKSTLLRVLVGGEEPSSGSVSFGHRVLPSYFAQLQAEALDPSKTVIEEVYEEAPSELSITEVRSVLGRFLLSGDDVYKMIGQLSGGERSRVALAKMLLRPANVLLLDEPTNHLDLGSIEALEEALQAFQGTVIVVSHDRRFLDKVATKVVEIEDGKLTLYLGNYSYYHEKKSTVAAVQPAPERPKPKQPPKVATAAKKSPTGLKRRIADLECQINDLEDTLAAIEHQLGQPEIYQCAERAAGLSREYAEVREQLEKLTEEWVDLHD